MGQAGGLGRGGGGMRKECESGEVDVEEIDMGQNPHFVGGGEKIEFRYLLPSFRASHRMHLHDQKDPPFREITL